MELSAAARLLERTMPGLGKITPPTSLCSGLAMAPAIVKGAEVVVAVGVGVGDGVIPEEPGAAPVRVSMLSRPSATATGFML